MIHALFLLAAGSITLIFGAWGASCLRALPRRHRLTLEHALARPYTDILGTAMRPRENLSHIRFPRLRESGARRLLAEIAGELSSVLYGRERDRIARLVRREGIDRFLLARAARSCGSNRARWLRTLSALPLGERTQRLVERYEYDADREVRFSALVCRIAHHPDTVKHAVETYAFPLDTLEVTEIALLLRDRFVPENTALGLLDSAARPGRLLGLAVVRLLGMREAVPAVYRLCTGPDPAVRFPALSTLSDLHASLDDPRVVRAVSDLSEPLRRRFYRRVVAEGYSLHALRKFLELERDGFLCEYLRRLVISRKRMLRQRTART